MWLLLLIFQVSDPTTCFSLTILHLKYQLLSKSLATSVQWVIKRSTIICKQPTCNNPENLWPCQLCYWYPLILDLIITQLDPYWLLLSFCSFSTQFLVISKIYHYFSNLLLEVRDHKGSKKDIAWFWGKLASNLWILRFLAFFLEPIIEFLHLMYLNRAIIIP